MAPSGQAIFGRDMIFNLTSVLDKQVVPTADQQQADIDKLQGNARRVMHDYAIGDQVYVEITGICRKLYYSKQGLYIITEVF